jgi:hypothetical protein
MKYLREHRLKLLIAALVVIFATAGSFGISRAQAQAYFFPDHYLGYRISLAATPVFGQAQTFLGDQFNGFETTRKYDVLKPDRLYNPALKIVVSAAGGLPVAEHVSPVFNPNLHYLGHPIKPVDATPFQPVIDMLVFDQFGAFQVDVRAVPVRLLVPTAKSVGGAPEQLNPNLHPANHYACYQIRLKGAYNTENIFNAPVILRDQFVQPKLYKVGAPTLLCNPVRKVHQGPEGIVDVSPVNAQVHLLCLPVSTLVPHVPVSRIGTNNQFGPQRLTTRSESELCAPARKLHPSGIEPIGAAAEAE